MVDSLAGLFGTSGIRGIYGKRVAPELAMRVGNAVGAGLKKLVVARDARGTSPVLLEALSSGAMLAGAGVIDIGMAPTPLLAYAAMKEKCDGAMITASHNPPEYNGIKLFSDGMEHSREKEAEVEAALAAGNWKQAEWGKAGQRLFKDYSLEYILFLLSRVDAGAIRERRPRVLVDAGNAAASSLAPALLLAAGCEVVPLYCDSPGKFVRNLEPKRETLSAASKMVKEKCCDFGVAFDGDGDRAVAIDENGAVLPLDTQLAVFCRHFLSGKKGGKIVTTVEASLCVREAVERLGGTLSTTRVGSLHVAEEMQGQYAAFGGEPCGEYVFAGATPCADGLLAAIVVAEMFSRKGKLSALAKEVKEYPIERRKYPCDEGKKSAAMGSLAKRLSFPEAKLSKIDGLRYDFPDGWLLVRPSGTEPAIRLTCEFREKERLEKTLLAAEQEIKSAT